MNRKAIALAILLASGSAISSPGDDGCVGNCGGGGGTTTGSNPVTINSSPSANALAGAAAQSNARANSRSVGVGVGMGGNATGGSATSSARGGNASVTNNTEGATQGQVQGQTSDQANAQTTNVEYNEARAMRYSGGYEVKTVGVAVAPDIQATAGCRKPISTSGGWMGGAFAFGTTFLDETCVRGELIRFGLTSQDQKTRNMTNDLLQYDLAKELEIARKAEDKEAKRKVKATQSGDFAPSDVADNSHWFSELGG